MVAFNAIHAEITWTLSDDGTLTISGTGDMSDYIIRSPWYSQREKIKEIVIEDGVTKIGVFAFDGCSNLTSINIPNSLKSIGYCAFQGCSGLTSVTIPNSVTTIDAWAFNSCSGLTSIIVEQGNTKYDSRNNCNAIIEKESNTLVVGCMKTIIPSFVTSIGIAAFSGCSGLTSITIPNSVTKIDSYAFRGCSGLTTVTIGNSVTSIGNSAFDGCSGLTSITIPNSVTSIGNSAFEKCSGLTSVTIGNSVTSIGQATFSGCELQTLTIGTDVTSIDYNIFGRSPKPQKVIWLPNTPPSGYENASGNINYVSNGNYKMSNTKVYKYLSSMFEVDGIKYVPVSPSERTCDAIDCNYEKTIEDLKIDDVVSYKNIGMNVLNINPYTCYGNEFVKTLNINNSGKVDERAFEGCKNITSVTLGNKVSCIGDYAFYGCTAIKEIKIPDGITSVGAYGFSGCTTLKSLTVGKGTSIMENYCFENCKALQRVIIGDGSTSICEYCFKGCKALQSVTIGDGSISVSQSCFSGLSSLQNLKVGNGAKLGNNCFENCSSLRSVEFGISLTFGESCFENCSALQDVTIGDGTTLGISCFKQCNKLKNVTINGSSSINANCFENCTALQSVSVGNGSSSIGNYCFKGCTTLQEITIGNGLTSVGDYSFSGCSLLQKVVLGESPVSIGNNAFENCSALAELNLGKKVIKIGKYTFANCSSLTKISIPKTTTSIGDYAFSGCNSLADVTIDDRTQSISLGSNGSYPLFADCPISSVYLGGKLSYKTSSNSGSSPFYRNKNLQSVVIADTEEQIYDNEFYGCTNLKSVKIGDGVKSIGKWAFSGCANLESFSFGKSMQSIGNEAFSDCTNMKSITSYATTAPKCGSQALDDIDKWSCVLAVPYSCLASYQNADQWKEFFFIQEAEQDNQTIADAVIAKITAIGKVEYTDVCKSRIDDASKAYDALTDDQKALVTNIEVLTKAQQTYETLKAAAEKLAADKAKADAVIAKITAIGKVEYTDACKGKIDAANKAYNVLTADQKALVTNLEVLTKAQQTYDNLKAAAEKLAADKAKADVVIAKITAIGKVEYTNACKGKIDDASKAYNALTDDQKALVTNLEVLTNAQQTYETLKAAAEKLEADKAVFNKYKSEIIAIIEALAKDDDSDAVKEIIRKAISDIEALEYEEAISLDDNKAKVQSFVTSVSEAVENQRVEDQKPNGIEVLEFAERYNIYDLNGRKITNSMLKSGLYIRNGRKIVIK